MISILARSLADTWGFAPRILIIMFTSLYASRVLIELGLFKRLEFIGRPLVRLARLPGEAGISFVASFGSVLVGNTMTAGLYESKRLTRRQTILTVLLNTTPVYVKETFTYQIPVMIPLLGLKVGLLYFVTFLASGMFRVFFVVVCGKMMLKGPDPESAAPGPDAAEAGFRRNPRRWGELLISSLRQQKKFFFKVAVIFSATTFLIFLLINSGAVTKLLPYVAPLTAFFRLPSACAIPVGTYMFSPLVGASAIGTMLTEGALTDLQGITACVLGSLLTLPVFALRYSFAKYVSIFGLSLGCGILGLSISLGMFSRGAVLLLLTSMQ